ncbi:hypothetical protein [Candidatus Tisiphia endosymbiont of Hybos culiciformis]|uniref:hypothetical protein n=1 Tax=Candidatus Tisiphia endosymbiont of Hybos culiciformis TaxID=3139331 RepID=UPI003CCB4CE0
MIKNYGLFEKYLAKISSSTISKFGSIEDISNFLLYLCEHGIALNIYVNTLDLFRNSTSAGDLYVIPVLESQLSKVRR